MTPLTALGCVAATCTTLAFVPQVLRVWRTRSATDISGAMYGLFILGLALWVAPRSSLARVTEKSAIRPAY